MVAPTCRRRVGGKKQSVGKKGGEKKKPPTSVRVVRGTSSPARVAAVASVAVADAGTDEGNDASDDKREGRVEAPVWREDGSVVGR